MGIKMPKVLVVDDSIFQRKTICQALAEAGFETVEAENGRQGLEMISEENPDVIFTDLLMPEMDGIAFITTIKERGIGAPVFVLTADIQESKRSQCLALGVAGFLSKPFKKAELMNALGSRLQDGGV
jgi:twitching motility two-component system response regulator PilH